MHTSSPIHLAYVSLITMLLALLSSPAVGKEDPSQVLMNFEDAHAAEQWRAVNDDVMGGVSRGRFRVAGGLLIFNGKISLENNGGFASVRSSGKVFDLSDRRGLKIRVRGDGRTYSLTLQTDARIPAGSFRYEFDTRKGKWLEISAPFSEFDATAFGRELPIAPKLNTAKIRSIGFLLADEKAGEFELEVDWVKAYGHDETGMDIVATAEQAGSFKTLLAAVEAAGLVEALKADGPLTVFAPTDEAFAKLPEGTVESLLKPENKDQLTAILTYHVVPGEIRLGRREFASLQGELLTINAPADELRINEVRILKADLPASNGVIHVIDSVLLPRAASKTSPAGPRELIQLAIRRGVPLFNSGQVAACRSIYEITAQSLLSMHGEELSESDRETLRNALEQIEESDSPRQDAWTLRRALDKVYRNLQE